MNEIGYFLFGGHSNDGPLGASSFIGFFSTLSEAESTGHDKTAKDVKEWDHPYNYYGYRWMHIAEFSLITGTMQIIRHLRIEFLYEGNKNGLLYWVDARGNDDEE